MSRSEVESARAVVQPAADLVVKTAERTLAVGHWLMAAHLRREEVRRAWARPYGAAALPCGMLFSAVRLPERLVHAAVGTDVPVVVAARLADGLAGGPVIRDPQSRRYYVLTPAGVAGGWRDADAECLGRGAHLVVPRPDAVEPHAVASYWAVAMASPGALCDPARVAELVRAGRARLNGGGTGTSVAAGSDAEVVRAADGRGPGAGDSAFGVTVADGPAASRDPAVTPLPPPLPRAVQEATATGPVAQPDDVELVVGPDIEGVRRAVVEPLRWERVGVVPRYGTVIRSMQVLHAHAVCLVSAVRTQLDVTATATASASAAASSSSSAGGGGDLWGQAAGHVVVAEECMAAGTGAGLMSAVRHTARMARALALLADDHAALTAHAQAQAEEMSCPER